MGFLSNLFGGSDDTDEASDRAEAAARDAERDELERKAKLSASVEKIRAAFRGALPTQKFSWKGFTRGDEAYQKVKGLPENFVSMNAKEAARRAGTKLTEKAKKNLKKTWGVYDLSTGKFYKPGEGVVFANEKGKRGAGGFDKKFYDKYKNAMLGYYEPQVADQYTDAKKEATYRLANAGTLQSSAAVNTQADLYKQNLLNIGDVRNQASTATANLGDTVASAEDNAILQANSVSDPNVAVSSALNKVNDLSLSQPSLSPLGEVFKVATIGAASGLGGYTSEQDKKRIRDIAKASNTVYA
jgi:hypothetical protein